MEISPEMLQRIAHLARLEIKPEEETELIHGLEQVLNWMEELTQADTEGVEPLTHITTEFNVWREDVGQNDLSREDALRLAPSATDQYISVPKVLE